MTGCDTSYRFGRSMKIITSPTRPASSRCCFSFLFSRRPCPSLSSIIFCTTSGPAILRRNARTGARAMAARTPANTSVTVSTRRAIRYMPAWTNTRKEGKRTLGVLDADGRVLDLVDDEGLDALDVDRADMPALPIGEVVPVGRTSSLRSCRVSGSNKSRRSCLWASTARYRYTQRPRTLM